jgi:DNA-binding NtrC family response regulator
VKVLLVATELMLRSRVEGALTRLACDVVVADTSQSADEELAARPSLLVVDLQSAPQPLDLIQRAVSLGVPAIAYGQHTKGNVLQQARRAGAVAAVTRSELLEQLPAVLQMAEEAAEPASPSPNSSM